MPQRRPTVRAALLAAGTRKIMKHSLSFLALVLLASFWLPATASAIRPMGTTMTGVIQSVDHSTQWITFAQDGGPVRQFVYSEWAKFWHDEAESLPANLKPGMRVQIKLHNPLIGPDFVRQIVLLNQAGGVTNPKSGRSASTP